MGLSGPLPIPFAEIDAYCSLRGITSQHERDRLIRFLTILDQEWMRAHTEQAEKNSASRQGDMTPPPPSHSPPREGNRHKSKRAPLTS